MPTVAQMRRRRAAPKSLDRGVRLLSSRTPRRHSSPQADNDRRDPEGGRRESDGEQETDQPSAM